MDFKLLFEKAPGLFLVLRPDPPTFTILGASDAYLRATLTQREGIVGRGLFEVFPDNPDDPAASGTSNLRASLERVLATKAADTMAVQKYDIRRPESEGGGFEERFWSPGNSPVLSSQGDLLYVLHRVEDVTEFVRVSRMGEQERERSEVLERQTRKMELEILRRSQELDAANKKLRSANDQLAALDRAKTDFFSNISHEFRTPLTLLLGPIEDALAGGSETIPLARERLELVRHNSLRLLKLVNTLLDFSSIEAGRMRVVFRPADIAALTVDLASVFRSAVEKAGLRFVVECSPIAAEVYVDPEMWEKIVLNLVSNAFKFTLEGEIAVRLRDIGSSVELTVSDTGRGIPEHEQSRVFERFHRVQGAEARTHEGTGIGLSLVQELVKLHGGTIRVESAAGNGSTFTVVVPKGKDHLPPGAVGPAGARSPDTRGRSLFAEESLRWLPAEAMARKADTERRANAAAGPNKDASRILLVDDNADLRKYVSELLSDMYSVEAETDGVLALEAARRRPPDLVLTDVMMPRLDGFGFLRELRSEAKTRHIPVILLSARAGEEAAVEGLEAGADDYLVKPFSARELLARVKTHLELARLRREWSREVERAEQRREAMRALRESEQRYRRIVETTNEGVWMIDAALKTTFANARMLALVGREQIELIGSSVFDLVHTESRAALAANLVPRQDRSPQAEIRLVHKDGSDRWVLIDSAPILDEAGTEEGWLAMAMDVTDRKRLEEQLRQAQRLEAVGRLAGGIAHDFNNMLTPILSYASMILREVPEGHRTREDLLQVQGAAQRAADLVKQLLAFSRQKLSQPQALELNAYVAGLEKILKRTIGERIDFRVRLDHAAGNVFIDPTELEQVIMNLVLNARDAMPQGGRLKIETSAATLDDEYARKHLGTEPGPHVMLVVSDTGEGMDRETQARIFEPFFTTKPAGKGTGLGLATVYALVNKNRGAIWLYSERGRGTTFKVYFPRHGGPATSVSGQYRFGNGTGRGTETILVVEDDELVRRTARAILQRSGYAVLEARDGGQALAVSQKHSGEIHLMLTDVVMPNMTGRELAGEIATERPRLKVVYMSGYTSDEALRRAVVDEGAPFVQKPFTLDSLLGKIRAVLDATQA
jgi:PAS domain S-box-containing protein